MPPPIPLSTSSKASPFTRPRRTVVAEGPVRPPLGLIGEAPGEIRSRSASFRLPSVRTRVLVPLAAAHPVLEYQAVKCAARHVPSPSTLLRKQV
ncbi:hypothetical protein EI94DRAFT_1717892 [Lactarius quietus]|nr:hypothetical protein EI94DRAFT_1717892 [Lactarius quietus]